MNQTFCSWFLYKCVSMKEILAWGHCSYYCYSEALGVLQQIHATSWVSCAEVLGYFFSCRVLPQECAWRRKFTSHSVTFAYGKFICKDEIVCWSSLFIIQTSAACLTVELVNLTLPHPSDRCGCGIKVHANLLTFLLAGVAPWVKDCFLCIVEICFVHISHQICA